MKRKPFSSLLVPRAQLRARPYGIDLLGIGISLGCGTNSKGRVFLQLAFQLACLWERGRGSPFCNRCGTLGEIWWVMRRRKDSVVWHSVWYIWAICGIWDRARVGRHLQLLGGSFVVSFDWLTTFGFCSILNRVLGENCLGSRYLVWAYLFWSMLTLSHFMQNTGSIGCVKALQNALDHEYLVLSSHKFHAGEYAP